MNNTENNNFFFEIKKYSNLLRELVIRDVKKKYRRSVLGILWSMLNPIMIMLIMSFVFSHLFRFDIANYPMYLIVGQVFFNFYAEATNFSMGSIIENGALIKKTYVPKYLFTISRVMSSLVNLAFTMPAILFIAIVTGNPLSWHFLFSIVPIFLLFIFCMGVGLFLAAAAVYFRDMIHLYGVIIAALNYATPTFYPITIIPEKYRYVMYFNPLTHYLDAFRDCIYLDKLPSFMNISMCALMAGIMLLIGAYVFKKCQDNFILYI